MKNQKISDDIQLKFNFINAIDDSSGLSNEGDNVVKIMDFKNSKDRTEKLKILERIVSLSDHLYK